jgi:hypothetical protein
VLAARRLGFRITRQDIHRAWLLQRRSSPSPERPHRLRALSAEGLGAQR